MQILMQVRSIAECSFCKSYDLQLSDNWSLNLIFGVIESGHFRQVLLYIDKLTFHSRSYLESQEELEKKNSMTLNHQALN